MKHEWKAGDKAVVEIGQVAPSGAVQIVGGDDWFTSNNVRPCTDQTAAEQKCEQALREITCNPDLSLIEAVRQYKANHEAAEECVRELKQKHAALVEAVTKVKASGLRCTRMGDLPKVQEMYALAQQDQPAGEWVTINEDGSNLPEKVEGAEWYVLTKGNGEGWVYFDGKHWLSKRVWPVEQYEVVQYWSAPYIARPRPEIPAYTATKGQTCQK